MNRKLQGTYQVVSTIGERVSAFIPNPLPPNPPIEWTSPLRQKFDQALVSLGRLDGISSTLPEPLIFQFMYVRKEAVLSSMIEGTQSSLSDLLIFELEQKPNVPIDDVLEVSNYISAMNHGLNRLSEGFPLSLRLLKEVHAILMKSGRGSHQTPGEFRRSQNWIGGTRPGNASFVPPPPENVMGLMGSLELFLHDEPKPTPVILKAALAHVQFETIHPFLDGNGRLGRLLITLLLCEHGILKEPLLYLSLYFKTKRQGYYELLNRVRFSGDWEAWLDFFADAVIFTSNQAIKTAQELLDLANSDRKRIRALGRSSYSVLQVHTALLEQPIATCEWLVQKTKITPSTINKCLRKLESLGIVTEITNQKRNRLYSYRQYLAILDQGTDHY